MNRDERLAACAEAIERECQLLGATAVEDKLQEGVPETVQTLRDAGALVWMLTGDSSLRTFSSLPAAHLSAHPALVSIPTRLDAFRLRF